MSDEKRAKVEITGDCGDCLIDPRYCNSANCEVKGKFSHRYYTPSPSCPAVLHPGCTEFELVPAGEVDTLRAALVTGHNRIVELEAKVNYLDDRDRTAIKILRDRWRDIEIRDPLNGEAIRQDIVKILGI